MTKLNMISVRKRQALKCSREIPTASNKTRLSKIKQKTSYTVKEAIIINFQLSFQTV